MPREKRRFDYWPLTTHIVRQGVLEIMADSTEDNDSMGDISGTSTGSTSNQAWVSTIILANHRPVLVGNAIESALRQSYRQLEVIVVQDSDNSDVSAVVRSYAQENPRVKYYRNPRPGNIARASNFAVECAQGKYIAVLDDDDEWQDRWKTEHQVEFLERSPDHVAVGGGVVVVDARGREIGRYSKPLMDLQIRRMALIANPIANSSALFRRETWLQCGKYDETLDNFHDWEFWLRMGLVGRLANIDRSVLRYRLWDGGSSWVRISSNAVCAQRIVRKYRKSYPRFYIAAAVYAAYGCYAKLPEICRRSLYMVLSKWKKRWTGGARQHTSCRKS